MLLGSALALADNGTWLGTTDATWAGANWSVSPVPGGADTATFNGTGNGNTTIGLGGGVTVNTIVFDTALAAGYTLGSGAVGSQTLTLSNGGAVTVNAGLVSSQQFNAAIVLGADGNVQTTTFTNNSAAGLTFAGAISGSTGADVKTLAVAGSGNTSISGVISNGTTGTVALSKSGAGVLTISGAAKTYSGGTTISQGVLSISAANHLGTGTTLLDGGTLRSTGAANVDINTATAMTIGASGGTINSMHTAGTFRFQTTNALLGSGTLTVTGNGTLSFAGTPFTGIVVLNAANTYNGNVILQNGGLLEVANAGGLATGATVTVGSNGGLSLANLTFARNVTVNAGGTLLFQNGNNGAFSGAIALNGASTIRMQDWYGTTVRSGAITGTISGSSPITVNSGSGVGGTLTFKGFDAKASSAGITINAANLTVDSSAGTAAASVTRANSLTIVDGNFTVNGVASQNTNDVFTTLNLNTGPGLAGTGAGYTTWALNPNAATNAALTFTNMGTRTAGSWVALASTVGATPAANTANIFFTNDPTGPNYIGGGGALGSSTSSVFPWLRNNLDGATLYTHDATRGVTPLTGQVANYTSGATTNATGGGTLTANQTINSLSGLNANIVMAGNTLTISSGALASTFNAIIGSDATTPGTLSFGTAEGIVSQLQARQLTINSAVTGSGGLTFLGFRNNSGNKGTFILNGANTYTGVTNIYGYGGGNNAVLFLTHSLALQNTTLNYVAGRGSNISFGNGGTSGQSAYTFGGLSGNLAINLNNNNITVGAVALTVGGNGDSTSYTGALSSTVAGGGIVKTGGGTLSLGGANTYSGTTLVNAGTLRVNATHTNAGAYTVNSGGTLGGSGSITTAGNAGATVGAGGKLSPGTSIGTLTMDLGTGSLDISGAVASASSQAMVIEIGATGDKVVLSGSTALNIGTGVLEFDDFNFIDLGNVAVGTYTLVDSSTTITGPLGANVSGTINGFITANLGFADSGKDLVLNVTAVPEPSSLGLLGLASLGLLARRRRDA